MSGRCFVDTNVLVYCFDGSEREKQRRALGLLEDQQLDLVVSTQVLQEFYVTVTRKLASPLPEAEAERAVRELSTLPVVQIDAPMILAAIATSRTHRLSFWDALILEAARGADCVELLTEDLQEGFTLGPVKVVNPFLPR
jgi:predicted nucleic acid-binding protein